MACRAMVKLDIRQKLWMALDVAKGMHYLHSCRPPIVHGGVNSIAPSVQIFRVYLQEFSLKGCACLF